ncbi:hypothetical protein [Chryseobacterium sp. Mn2064]|uniref:hypothetical protein n=1 Tax=Chryseobacterium sp. Mn2064 TaxID=3395263 RepID=UPI003BE8D5CE
MKKRIFTTILFSLMAISLFGQNKKNPRKVNTKTQKSKTAISMISTKDFSKLPDRKRLQTICKSVSVLDAILSQEWEYRYYSYDRKWADHEEVFEMRNGSGDQMLILFRDEGCAINGFAREYKQQDKQKLTRDLPPIFHEFMFGEPVQSIGTTFCLWSTEAGNWKVGEIGSFDDNSGEMLNIFDGNPQTYVNWATEYFEESYKESGIPLKTVTEIYNGQILTKQMVLSMVEDIEDWKKLEADLDEIGYPYHFN